MQTVVYRDAIEAIEFPALVHLDTNLTGAAFALMKLLPAKYSIDQACRRGELDSETTVIESTSGTFGLALARVCASRGHRLVLVSDPVIDEPLRRQLDDLGAVLHIVQEPSPEGGFQVARLDLLHELRASIPNTFWPSQYEDPANPASYAPLADYLVRSLGRIDVLVGTVGSGGSMSGTARELRRSFPNLRVVGVDTFGSVLFGGEDTHRTLRGLGNSIMPRNLDHAQFDEVHWVTADEAFAATRRLHRGRGLFMGPTSGAAFLVAEQIAAAHPAARVVALLPDPGHRYATTVYDDDWLYANGHDAHRVAHAPETVATYAEALSHGTWSRVDWSRRSIEEVRAAW